MAMCNRKDRLHVRGAAKGMNSDDGACARRNGSLNQAGIEIERPRLDIEEYRGGALISNSISRRNKSERGHDHFITGTDSKRTDAQMQPCRSGANRDAKALTGVPADQFFKLLHLRAQAQSRAAKNGDYFFNLGFGDVWLRERNIQDGNAPESSFSSNRSRDGKVVSTSTMRSAAFPSP